MSFDPQMNGESLPPRSSRSKITKKKSYNHLYLLITFALLIVGSIVYWWIGQDRTAFTTESSKEMAGSSQPSVEAADEEDTAIAQQMTGVEETATEEEPAPAIEQALETEQIPEQTTETEAEQTDSSSAGEITVLAHHRVLPGETLYSITMKYYGSKKYMDELAAYNGIGNNSNIRTGTVLKIPDLQP